MKTIIIVMLAIEVAIFLVVAIATMFSKLKGHRRPVWTSFGIGLIIVAGGASQIADKHSGQPGADLLDSGALLLLGMALMAMFVAIRERRGPAA